MYFNHRDMDFYFSWIVGRQTFGGSEAGECFATATCIVDGAPESWQNAWVALAKRVEARAETALNKGHTVSAREAYLRACTYYRAPLFIMSPKDPTFYENWQKLQFCFRKAASLFTPPIEAIEVPFGAKMLPGYFWKADDSGKKRPTVIIVGGIETFAEDTYFLTGSLEMGLHCAEKPQADHNQDR